MKVLLVTLLLCLLWSSHGYRLTKEKREELRKNEPKEEVSKREDALARRANCPNDCSGHGACSNGLCSCDIGYTGTDCSLEERVLTSGVSVSSNVATFQWKYYYIPLVYRGNLKVELNQTSSTGDCDIYVQLNDIPTRNNYYKRDITIRTEVSFQMEALQPGTWYFGIYGFLACSYTFRVTTEGTCPNECSNHGSCFSGTCLCNNGYMGVDCSEQVTQITLSTPVVGSVADLKWSYYHFSYQSSASADELLVTLNQTSSGDADLYLRFQLAPTEFQYDYANITVRAISTIKLTDPQSGDWYIGIHGFRACSYVLLVSTAGECPNQCSGRTHGMCNGNACTCNAAYSGDYCQTRNAPLHNGEGDVGYVSASSWNYFSYRTNSIANLMISISQSGDGDCDLYAKAGAVPTRVDYDASDVGTLQNFTLTIPDPGVATWYLGIYGWSQCSFSIVVTETSNCAPGCSAHGYCLNGTCICSSGWSGEACATPLSGLTKNVILSDSMVGGTGQWKYYSYTTPAGATSVHIALKEDNTDGWLWLFVSKGVPDLRNYLYADTETNSQMHRIHVALKEEGPITLQIGVFANPYSLGERIPFRIIAWSPEF